MIFVFFSFEEKKLTLRDGFLLGALTLTFMSSLVFGLHGVGVSNVPAFLMYIVLVTVCVMGRNTLRLRLSFVSSVSLLFFCIAFFSIFLQNHLNGSVRDINAVDTFGFAINNLIITFVYFLCGWLAVFPRENNLGVYAALPLAVLALVFLPFGLTVLDYDSISSSGEREVNHLTVAPNVIFMVFLSVAYSNGFLKWFFYLVGLVFLFMVGSRTALVFGAFVIAVVPLILGGRKKFLSGAFVLMALAGLFFLLVEMFDKDVSERMFFGSGLADDSSGASRLMQFAVGVDALKDQVFLGDMNFVVHYFGGVGFFMHNILSFWQEFGFPVFFLVVLLLVAIVKEIWLDLCFLRGSHSSVIQFRVYLGAYVVISAIFSMSYTFKILWFAVGMYSVSYRSFRLKPRLV